MEEELKDWLEDKLRSRNTRKLNTDNFLAISAFGMRAENNQIFDFSITFKRNKAIIQGEWEVIEDAISFSNNHLNTLKLENLVRNIIQHLQKGGRFQLNRNLSVPYYIINRNN